MVHWWRNSGRVDVTGILDYSSLPAGWDALAAELIGFGAAVPFMDTTLFEGPASSSWLHGGDIAFLVGFVVGGLAYAVIRAVVTRSARDVPSGRVATEPAPDDVTLGATLGPVPVSSES